MLPFVRGVDLSGNDFKVRQRVWPPSRPSLPLRPRSSPLPVPPAPGLCAARDRGRGGWGYPGTRASAPEDRHRAQPGRTLGLGVPPGEGSHFLSPYRDLGPTRAREGPGGLQTFAPASPALLLHPLRSHAQAGP